MRGLIDRQEGIEKFKFHKFERDNTNVKGNKEEIASLSEVGMDASDAS